MVYYSLIVVLFNILELYIVIELDAFAGCGDVVIDRGKQAVICHRIMLEEAVCL